VAGGPSFLDSTWYLLARAGSLAYQRWAAMITDFDLSPTQYKVLMTLGESGALCQQRLAELIDVDARNCVPIVESLVERGLIEREVDPVDRRRRLLDLSPAGRGVAEGLASVGTEIEREILRPMPRADQARLRHMLTAMLDAAGHD
jgi:DNA-binding MarR family transcriptional regulator